MKCKYAVTFEFDTLPPLTHRGELEARSVHTIAARAIKEAKKKEEKAIRWSSMVVLLERMDSSDDEEVSALPEGAEDAETE